MDNKILEIHNKGILFCEEDALQNQINDTDDVENKENQELNQLKMGFEQNIKQLKNFAEVLEQFTLQIIQKLKKLKQEVEESISHINEKKNQIKNISNDFTNLQQTKINEQKNIVNNSLEQIILQFNNQLKEIQICMNLDQLYQLLNNQLQSENSQLKHGYIEENRVIEMKSDCQLIQQSSYKQKENCFAIAFNQDASIMIAGCGQLIKVFKFKKDKLRELQELNGHSKRVFCLQFMKKSNQFLSGSDDSIIIIWGLSQYQQWQCIQVLKSHKSSIFCLTMNQNEDLLISGSCDSTIKFWENQNNTWSCNQSIDCQSIVYSISLSNQEDKLIASVYDQQILVLQLSSKQWMIKQNISVELYGQRLFYINQNQFIFQSYCGQNLQIFGYDDKDQTYKQEQEVKYQNQETRDDCLFPIQYLSQIGLIILKNGRHVHLIKRNKNGQFRVEQSINFNTHNLYGCVENDGKYIATWDNISEEIQIRKLNFENDKQL